MSPNVTLDDLKPDDLTWVYSLIGMSIWLLIALTFFLTIRLNPYRTSFSTSSLLSLNTPSTSLQTPLLRSNTFLTRSNTIQKRVTFISEHIGDMRFLNSLVQARVYAISQREPEHDDEVGMEKGDALVVYYVFSDAWGYGINERDGAAGMFPLCMCLLK